MKHGGDFYLRSTSFARSTVRLKSLQSLKIRNISHAQRARGPSSIPSLSYWGKGNEVHAYPSLPSHFRRTSVLLLSSSTDLGNREWRPAYHATNACDVLGSAHWYYGSQRRHLMNLTAISSAGSSHTMFQGWVFCGLYFLKALYSCFICKTCSGHTRLACRDPPMPVLIEGDVGCLRQAHPKSQTVRDWGRLPTCTEPNNSSNQEPPCRMLSPAAITTEQILSLSIMSCQPAVLLNSLIPR